MTDELERGTARPASDDYALDADYANRGKLGPCPGCGDAPDHRLDDQKCVENRVRAVRSARQAQAELLKLKQEQSAHTLPDSEVAAELRRLMVD